LVISGSSSLTDFGNLDSETYQFASIYEFTEVGRLIETWGVPIDPTGEISDRNPGFRELV
jgi:hypothetical protein